ncbi:hypothetical protein, partial [Silvimonas terrae]|uniref:hypothetical protein n=1 Tax=Silvimonas terrae TaxID=300266 RepID=UPI001C865DF9
LHPGYGAETRSFMAGEWPQPGSPDEAQRESGVAMLQRASSVSRPRIPGSASIRATALKRAVSWPVNGRSQVARMKRSENPG